MITGKPFPHLVRDGWWDDSLLRGVLAEFPDPAAPGWRRYNSGNEHSTVWHADAH